MQWYLVSRCFKHITYFNIYTLLQINLFFTEYATLYLLLNSFQFNRHKSSILHYAKWQMMTYHMCLLCTDDIDTSIYLLTHVNIYHPHYLLLGRHFFFPIYSTLTTNCCCVWLYCRVDSALCSQHLHNVRIFKLPYPPAPPLFNSFESYCVVLTLSSIYSNIRISSDEGRE